MNTVPFAPVAEGDPDPLGVAIIGAGLMGSLHARTAIANPLVRLVGIFAADASQAGALASTHDIRVFNDLQHAINDDAVEAVIIATPTDTHAEIACMALEAGVHAFIEKPVTRTLDAAHEIQRAAQRHQRVAGVGHVARYFPEYRMLREQIRAGSIGDVAIATFGRRCQQPDWSPDAWHTSMQRSGGVAVDMLVHDIDLVRWYFGEPSHVYARVTGSDRYDGLDYALATLTIPDGPICHLHGSWAEPEGFSQSAEICGTLGMLSYDSRGRDTFQFATHAADARVTALPDPPAGEDDPFQLQLSDFVRAARLAAPFPGDIAWAIGSLRIALAMLESSDSGTVISLERDQVSA